MIHSSKVSNMRHWDQDCNVNVNPERDCVSGHAQRNPPSYRTPCDDCYCSSLASATEEQLENKVVSIHSLRKFVSPFLYRM